MENMDEKIKGRLVVIVFIILALIVYSTNVYIEDSESIFGLVPVNTMISKTYFWNILSSSFYENNRIKLLFDAVITLTTIRSLRVLSLEQFTLYSVTCLALASLSMSTVAFFKFVATTIQDDLVTSQYGFSGAYITLLMFSRCQNNNDAVFSVVPCFTYKYMPISYLAIQTILWFLDVNWLTHDIQFTIASIPITWLYLRFYYPFEYSGEENSNTIVYGNSSSDFTFIGMFPEVFHPILNPILSAAYRVSSHIGIVPELKIEENATSKAPHQQHHLSYMNASSDAKTSAVNFSSLVSSDRIRSTSDDEVKALEILQERRRNKAMKLDILETSKGDVGTSSEFKRRESLENIPFSIGAMSHCRYPEIAALKV